MNLTFKRREVKDLQHLGTLVTENAEAIEPGLRIVGSNLNLGRASVELAAIDSARTPVLITLGLTADDTMLLRALEAYAWCLEFPESIQKFVPATMQPEWPPRVVFVAERLLESFVRKMRLLKFSTVDFFEFRYVEAHGTTGFYLDRVDWERCGPSAPEVPERLERIVHRRPEPAIVHERLVPLEEAEPEPEREVVVHAAPDAVPEEPKVVMLHESKPAPRIVEPAPRVVEPAARVVEPAARVVEPPATNGASGGEAAPSKERQPVVLRGLRPPTEPSRGRRALPREEPAKPRRETALPPAAAIRSKPAEPAPKAASAPKSDLAPTWRKFLDRLTGTFDTRATPQPQTPRAGAPPSAPPPSPMVLQPFAADLQIAADEVAPDAAPGESHDPMPELTEQQRGILKGVTLPDNGELAPQWRKFLDHPSPDRPAPEHPALDEAKIAVVRGYVQREFPLCSVYDFFDFQRNAQVFQLQDNHGKVIHLITMTAEFFDTHRDLEIRAWIEKHRLAHAMRQAGQAGVLVSQAGLQMEKR